jgi:dihydropteroate synthase
MTNRATSIDDLAAAKRDRFFAAVAGAPQLMGIVNVTPDSFSDGGRFLARDAAIAEAQRHVAGGAAIVDVGAESTRPGYAPVAEHDELARLRPVLAELVAATDVAVSIDTTKASVAAFATAAGAAVVNEQWGLQRDPAMADVVAASGAGLILMHNRDGIDAEADVIADMCAFFDRSLALADRAGIPRERIILDPGIGFGKSKAQNIRALGAGVAALRDAFGLPVLVGASRKSLFAALIGATRVEDRLPGTLAAHLAAVAHGARVLRVHDCAAHRDALAVTQAIADG